MLSLLLIIFAITLAQYASGNQRTVHVSRSADGKSDCCVYGNCSCNSLDHALANLASNVVINITTDVTLSSFIKSSKLENVLIVGQNDPIVKCENDGGIQFTSCHYCTIHNIVWQACGSQTKSAIKFSKSSSILINNCSFQYSKGQSVALSAPRGELNILHCSFMHSSYYAHHGAAIYFLSKTAKNTPAAISQCKFMYNKNVQSLVYIESKYNNNLTLNYSTFYHNQGLRAIVYAVSSNIYVHGKNVFHCNAANGAGGVYITNHSSVIFSKNSEISFIQNSVYYFQGGMVVLKFYSRVVFDQNSMVTFHDNKAVSGIIYSQTGCHIIFKANCKVTFSCNSAKQYENTNNSFQGSGGAISSYDNCYILFGGNASTTFTNNTADHHGGAIFASNTSVNLKETSSTVFTNNTAGRHGGAIFASNTSVNWKENSSTVFTKNTADWYGGAIYFDHNCQVSFEGNSSTIFNNNIADVYAGAIYLHHTVLAYKGNCFVLFYNNIAKILSGGAIYSGIESYLSFEENSLAVFNNNIANMHGGAITLAYTSIYFKGNSFTRFSNNNANFVGGGIYSKDCLLSFTANSSTTFSNNAGNLEGGAVYSWHSNVSFEGLSVTAFTDNIANKGGALSAATFSYVNFFDTSTVKFMYNKGTFDTVIYSTDDSKITATESFTVIFNEHLPKWCNNKCLPYADVLKIQSDGRVWCNNSKAFKCLSNKCKCKKLEDILPLGGLRNNSVIDITTDVTLSSFTELHFLTNISVVGHNNITVSCVNGGGLDVQHCSDLKIESITWVGCGNVSNHPVVSINFPGPGVVIQNCTFQYSLAQVIEMSSIMHDVSFNNCNFMNNNHGAVIQGTLWNYPNIKADLIFTININNCNFRYNGNIHLYTLHFRYLSENFHSVNHVYLHNSKFHNNHGVSVYLPNINNILHISGEVLFANNVAENGAGIYISDESSYVIFHKNSVVKFINNTVNHNGAAILLNHHSSIIFEQNSYVTFNENKAANGTIYSKDNSSVTFKTNCLVIFDSNLATNYGSAIYSFDNSHVTFTGNSSVDFRNNRVGSSADTDVQLGGAIFSENNGFVLFEGNSLVMFINNSADFGAAIFSLDNSTIIFADLSHVLVTNNKVQTCGALTSALFSSIKLTGNTTVTFNTNAASYTLNSTFEFSSSAICTFHRASIMFLEYSLIIFTNNIAHKSGANVFSDSNVTVQDYLVITFEDNIAQYSSGGGLTCAKYSNITVKHNSNVMFNSNSADQDGGAIHAYGMCKITFKDNSTSTIINNIATHNGGALFSSQTAQVSFEGNSTVVFANNTADYGGTFYFTNSTLTFKETSALLFYNNIARQNGGVGYFSLDSKMIIKESTTVEFENNMAEQNGGVLYCKMSSILFKGNSITILSSNRADNGGAVSVYDHCNITLTDNSLLLFTGNEAVLSGGAGYFNYQCNINMEENTTLTFINNKAFFGGALCVKDKTNLIFTGNSLTFFNSNLAIKEGGAIKITNDSSITLKKNLTIKIYNSIANYGGAIFLDNTTVISNGSDKNCLNFTNNTAKILGDSLYQDVHELCYSSCLSNRMINISNEFIATPPNELKLYGPAICIDNDNDTQCNSYYLQNIMLGREIVIPACVLDHYNRSMESTPLLVQSEAHPSYSIGGPKLVLISCNDFKGISVTGNKSLSQSTKFSISIALNTNLYSDWKQIIVKLIVELSPCYPGFWQYLKSEKCKCYSDNGIVFCSGSSSTIKKGYWFGGVMGKPTVTFCPINYCAFTYCKTSNGYCNLSPVQNDQCRSYRSGTACGTCMDGYTLSFDSIKCMSVESCTAGQTVLVTLLTVIYWIAIIALLLGMVMCRTEIGYLYGIVYYYSIINILLNRNLQAYRGLYLTGTIISSFFKTTPLFLGEFCLTAGMSGIDQQFIHYIHPSAIIIILVIVSQVAGKFCRIPAIINLGKLRAFGPLLILSYTSIASTSLLLMRSLTFHDIDNVYTYLSPDIEYFHGRHLLYGSVAFTCLVTIVFIPLFLTVEPFLKYNINFTKIKPLLDQFQDCYKNEYHCFAGYYMICRLLIITIAIYTTDEFVTNYMIIVVSGTTAFLHLTVRPYHAEILNTFDDAILHLIMFAAALSLLDDVESPAAISAAFVLVISPLLIFVVLTLFMHKDHLRKLATYLKSREDLQWNNDLNNQAAQMKEYDLVIDDSIRENTTILDI